MNAGLTAAQVSALVVHPSTSKLYAATTSDAIYQSSDHGASWSQSNLGFTTLVTASLAIDPVTPTTLYAGTRNLRASSESVFKSTDGGVHWSRSGDGIAFAVVSIVLDHTNPATVYAAALGGGVFKSTNGASTWSAVNNGLTDLDVQALGIDSVNPQILYAGTDAGVFKSIDGGASWTLANSGLTNTEPGHLLPPSK